MAENMPINKISILMKSVIPGNIELIYCVVF